MKKRLYGYSLFLLYTSWLFSLLGLLSEKHLIFDLASHFKFQYFLCGALCLIALVGLKAYKSAGVSCLLIAFNFSYLLPLYSSSDSQSPSDSSDIKILMNNVLTSNSSSEALSGLIEQEDPDIILLLEVNQRWIDKIASIHQQYPYSVIEPREDNFGIALYSKFPISNSEVKYYGAALVPSIVAQISSNHGEFTMIGTHPLPPINQQYYELRNEQIRAIANEARESDNPLLVAGDLNTTVWSSHYRVLETVGGLVNTSAGSGVVSTWPSFASIFGIQIDHILMSNHFVTNSFKVGSATGSDHRPLIVNLSFTAVEQ